MKFNHQFNFAFESETMSEAKNVEPSKTIPDMSYSVRELIERFTTGGVPPILQNGTYEESVNFNDAVELDVDLVDIQIARNKSFELKKQLKELEARKLREKATKIKEATEAKPKEATEIKQPEIS